MKIISLIFTLFLMSWLPFPALSADSSSMTEPKGKSQQFMAVKAYFYIHVATNYGAGYWADLPYYYTTFAACPPGSVWEDGVPPNLPSTAIITSGDESHTPPGMDKNNPLDYRKCLCSSETTNNCPPGVRSYYNGGVESWVLCSITANIWVDSTTVATLQTLENDKTPNYAYTPGGQNARSYAGGGFYTNTTPAYFYNDNIAYNGVYPNDDNRLPTLFNYNPLALPHVKIINFPTCRVP